MSLIAYGYRADPFVDTSLNDMFRGRMQEVVFSPREIPAGTTRSL
jgi:hypothetical protein